MTKKKKVERKNEKVNLPSSVQFTTNFFADASVTGLREGTSTFTLDFPLSPIATKQKQKHQTTNKKQQNKDQIR